MDHMNPMEFEDFDDDMDAAEQMELQQALLQSLQVIVLEWKDEKKSTEA